MNSSEIAVLVTVTFFSVSLNALTFSSVVATASSSLAFNAPPIAIENYALPVFVTSVSPKMASESLDIASKLPLR